MNMGNCVCVFLIFHYFSKQKKTTIKSSVFSQNFRRLLSKEQKSFDGLKMSSCLLNDACENSQKDRFVVAVHNPLSRTVSSMVRLPVNQTAFSIVGIESKYVPLFQIKMV